MMNKATAAKFGKLHEAHEGKTYRLNQYTIIAKAEGLPCLATVEKYEAAKRTTLEWYYSEGETDGICAYNRYEAITIR